jgi:hypothetical protein
VVGHDRTQIRAYIKDTHAGASAIPRSYRCAIRGGVSGYRSSSGLAGEGQGAIVSPWGGVGCLRYYRREIGPPRVSYVAGRGIVGGAGVHVGEWGVYRVYGVGG